VASRSRDLTASHPILGVTQEGVAFDVPKGSCDCHVHVFGPVDRFPYASARPYTPANASLADLSELHEQLGIQRVVIVQPSPYGDDNRCLLSALYLLGTRARGIVVLDPRSDGSSLSEMHAAGVRGARLNLQIRGIENAATAREEFRRLADLVGGRNWHIQIFSNLTMFATLADTIAQESLPPVVVDHFCLVDARRGTNQPGFDELVALIRIGKVWIKLSSPQRISNDPDGSDVESIARTLISANPSRILWGTDWPHPGPWPGTARDPSEIEPFHPFDDGHALNRLWRWTERRDLLQKILVDNPSRLYGFVPDR